MEAGVCVASANPIYHLQSNARYSAPHAHHVDQQNAEEKQKGNTSEEQAYEVGFAVLVTPGETVVGHDRGDDQKNNIDKSIVHGPMLKFVGIRFEAKPACTAFESRSPETMSRIADPCGRGVIT